ncbi:MAG: hypothetical protein WCE38_08210 [Burkholderiales bacterium]
MEWDKMLKRYVWDDAKTPYFVAVARLTSSQARHELFTYTLFLGILFGVLAVIALSSRFPHGHSDIVPLYAFSIVCGAIILGITKHYYAALYCASAPIAGLAYFAVYGFHANLGTIDKIVLVAVMLVWLRYCLRTIAIARAYPGMPDRSDTP